MTSRSAAPIANIYAQLASVDASWAVDFGRQTGGGWISGVDVGDPTARLLTALLDRVGRQMNTTDRLTIAASFALRFGWSSAMAIAPFLRFGCVPDVSLENVGFRFNTGGVLERAAIYEPRGIVVAGDPRAEHPSMTTVPDGHALLRMLRTQLVSQGASVARALHEWSGFAERGTWGMLTSSWASQFAAVWPRRDDQRPLGPLLDEFFAGEDLVAQMRPRMSALQYGGAVHLYQRRASCCRFYLLPGYGLCASCPLVSDEERLLRNREWMRSQIIP